jgi:hypothetical protein
VFSSFDSNVARKTSKSIILSNFSKGLPIADKRSVLNWSSNNLFCQLLYILALSYCFGVK